MLTFLQARLKKASRWLPVMLLPFAAQAQLNYSSANAVNTTGTYTDLAATGTVITTTSTDDANSAALPIGFTFNFNGAAFTQFVLNTNGYVKLGATAPSAATLLNPVGSADPLDVNIVAPLSNVDLQTSATATAEYRVFTSAGAVGSRVTTIQWKNVADKATASAGAPAQFASMQFQLKLYEGTNQIEFVYGTWVAGTGTATGQPFIVGLKGTTNGLADRLLGSKTSSATAWTTTTFTPGTVATTLPTHFVRNTFPPDAGRTYRFQPTVANDAAVAGVFTLGKVSSSFGSPVTVQAQITNSGSSVQTALPVTLTVSGATTFTNTQTIATLAAGASTVVTFTAYPVTGTTGTNTVTVTIPADGLASNNTQTYSQSITTGSLAFIDSTQPLFTGSVGVGAANGILAARYSVTQATVVSSVTATFTGAGTANTTYQIQLYDATGTGSTPGTVLYTSSTQTRPGATGTVTIPVPNIAVAAGDFFVAIKELDNNVALGYQVEDPLRPATFYYQVPAGAWTLVNTTTLRTRLALEVGLGAVACAPVSALAATNITTTSASIGFTGPTNGTTYTVTYQAGTGTITPVTPAPTASPVMLTGLTPGTTYTVTVTTTCGPGQTSAPVSTTFTTTPVAPANDLCSGAIALTCGTPVVGTTVGSTLTGDPTTACTVGTSLTPSASPGVFYSIAGNGQIATVSTCSGATATAGDTKLFIYSGTCGTLTCVASSDDFSGCGTNTLASSVTFQTVTGTTYYVFVQFYTAGAPVTGAFGLSLTCAAPVVTTYATLPYTQGFEGTWVNAQGTRDVPDTNWRNTPATGDNSWRRDDDGVSALWRFLGDDTDPTLHVYDTRFSTGAHSARFHTWGTASGTQGSLDLFVNMSAPGNKTLSFDYINPTGADQLQVLVSTDGGNTFSTTPVLTATTNTAFTAKTVSIVSTSATTVIRFRATSDFADDDLGIDNLRIAAVTSTRNEALAATVSVYPNPAHQRFTLDVPAGSLHAASAALINSLGQVVLTCQLNLPAAGGTVDFNVSNLAAGVYSLSLKSGNDLVVKRVVVE